MRSLLNKKQKTMSLQEPKLVLPTTFKINIPINLPHPPPHVKVFTFTCTPPNAIINPIKIGDDSNVQENDQQDNFLDDKENYED